LKGVRRVTPPRFRDMGTAIIGAGTLAGALLAPLLIVPLAANFGWRAAFLVTSSLGGLWLPFWLALARHKDANLDPVSQSVDAVTVTASTPKRTLTWSSRGVWATAFCIFFSIPPSVFTLAFFPRFLQATFGLEMAQTKNLQWQPYLAMDLGQITAGFLLIRMFRKGTPFLTARRAIMTTGFIGATTMTLMNFAPTLEWTMVWLDLSRFCFQFAYVGLLAYGISVVSENESGRMNGFMNAIFGACSAVFAVVIGNLSDRFHHDYRPVIWLVGLIPLVGLTGWTILSSQHAKRTGKDE
jgi:MFS transporter, ACS family, hexuronate transporter